MGLHRRSSRLARMRTPADCSRDLIVDACGFTDSRAYSIEDLLTKSASEILDSEGRRDQKGERRCALIRIERQRDDRVDPVLDRPLRKRLAQILRSGAPSVGGGRYHQSERREDVLARRMRGVAAEPLQWILNVDLRGLLRKWLLGNLQTNAQPSLSADCMTSRRYAVSSCILHSSLGPCPSEPQPSVRDCFVHRHPFSGFGVSHLIGPGWEKDDTA